MAEAKGNSLGTPGFIALSAFIAGRCSVDSGSDPMRAQGEPSYLATPAESADQSAGVFTEQTTEAPSEAVAVPESRFVAPEPEVEATVPKVNPAYLAEPAEELEEYVYWRNCSHARAAGAAPVRVGDAGYRAGLDRDGDGIGCE